MNKVLYFLGGLVIGGAAGAGTTFLVLKKREDKIINDELEKLSKEEKTEYKHNVFTDEPAIVPQNEEKPIPELAEMANKVKTEEGEKTDYTGFSKSSEEKIEQEDTESSIIYVDEEEADNLETMEEYKPIDMDYYQDNVIFYENDKGEDVKTTPEDLGVDMSKAQNNILYVANKSTKEIYLISINKLTYGDEYYDDEEEENENNGEQSES